MDKKALETTAKALVAAGKGILAADESTSTIGKRFKDIGVESTETTRRDYRHLLFTAPEVSKSISGVILYDETLRQKAPDGKRLADILAKQGIIPGIKVDTGAKDLAGHPGEKVTEGLDGLRERLAEYHKLGARFAKWRAVITIARNPTGPPNPTYACLSVNAHALGRYAALCQEAGIVPIVEPEVLMDGDHDIDTCDRVTRWAWGTLFEQLMVQGVHLPGILLKPSMIISGKDAKSRAKPEEVARRTVAGLRDCIPPAVPGIVFLSGGQTPEEATEHLRLMNALGPHPWTLSFSYGRALQEPALKAWGGKAANAKKAQEAFRVVARANSAAALGKKVVEAKAK
ncbi:MAG: fructose-bisphosphate aldolase, class [Thermoplasmata archaeon]|jgi:fructose-bisphosphate aldolase class I|nr:fructose-bisphosphate aldolase, class [Thermoplasmata archaeon]